jgi:arginine deiminase
MLNTITRLHVRSETGRLRQVVLHRPGREIELMSPCNHDALLFDDILLLDRAQAEHDVFANVLKHLGVQVLSFETLLAETLPIERGTPLNWRHELEERDYARWDIEFVICAAIQVHTCSSCAIPLPS